MTNNPIRTEAELEAELAIIMAELKAERPDVPSDISLKLAASSPQTLSRSPRGSAGARPPKPEDDVAVQAAPPRPPMFISDALMQRLNEPRLDADQRAAFMRSRQQSFSYADHWPGRTAKPWE